MISHGLAGRTALVTGGGSGQGRAIATALAREGANIVFGSFTQGHRGLVAREENYFPTATDMQDSANAIRAHGAQVVFQHHDLRNNESCQSLVDLGVTTFGSIDILVCAAGVSFQKMVTETLDTDWDLVLDINLTGAFRMIRRCLPAMMERKWGRIVIVGSTAANVGDEKFGAYCASKAGLLGLMRCVAIESAPHGVTCNAINPGFVNTGMAAVGMEHFSADKGISVAEAYRDSAAYSPMKRILEPDEVAELAAFLCSERAAGITMEDITIATGSLW